MTYDLFPQCIGTRHIAALTEKIAAYAPNVSSEHTPVSAFDKWVLASNLQKSIRRGLAHIAIGTATRLLALDARYFWRRLLLIAYEDVGFANIGLCYDLLKFFRREAAHAQLGVERVATYFVNALSQSLSRTSRNQTRTTIGA
jgi:replication-associated recombination protein RarA